MDSHFLLIKPKHCNMQKPPNKTLFGMDEWTGGEQIKIV